MLTDIGEFIVGAHLQLIEGCDVVDYNVRPPGGGIEGLGELDVIGLNLKTDTVFLCEVTTHLHGLRGEDLIGRLTKKHQRQKKFSSVHYDNFQNARFMFWSPRVPVGKITKQLQAFTDLELIINGEYKRRVNELRALAAKTKHDARNPFFRMLQIMEHMRD
jgi:hypothetical protein